MLKYATLSLLRTEKIYLIFSEEEAMRKPNAFVTGNMHQAAAVAD
jgi:hypothetical protein